MDNTNSSEGSAMESKILDYVLPYLPVNKELLKYRLVCPKWNEIITSSSKVACSFGFTIKGDKKTSLEAFIRLTPSFRPNLFRFWEVDLEGRLFASPRIFENFSRNQCPNLQTLILINCDLPASRFIEMMAFCRSIKRLQIAYSPQIFKPDLGIFHWQFCFRHVQKNLAGLTQLRLQEKILFNVDLLSLAKSTTNLRTLTLHIMEGYLPCGAICTVLANNAGTLKILNLNGDLFKNFSSKDDNVDILDSMGKIPEMKALETINLKGGNYMSQDHASFLHSFLSKCPNLLYLTLHNASIAVNSFIMFELRLLQLDLKNCMCGLDVLQCNFLSLNTLKICHNKAWHTNEDVLCESMRVLLLPIKVSLESLELKAVPCAPYCLDLILPENYPALRVLVLSNLEYILGPALTNFFQKFPLLESLSINYCDADDATLGTLDTVLENLQRLTFLSLANTGVGNMTAKLCIPRLKSLQHLDLSGTELTNEGLDAIFIATLTELKCLMSVSISNTRCELDEVMYARLANIAPEVTINIFQ